MKDDASLEMGYRKLENELRNKWDEILETLRIDYDISTPAFNTFIKILKIYSVSDNQLTILIDDANIGSNKNFIKNRYNAFLQVTIEEITGVSYEINYISQSEVDSNIPVKNTHKISSKEKNYPSINSKYTFDTFVVGDNNDYAHAASLKVAEEPGDIYNPLYIYGGAGLGKTHLMHAIANYILDYDDTRRVVYVTSETFVNEIVDAIRDKRGEGNSMPEFRKKYRNLDVLLIDDIQFIIGKETMQQEFFHTFNDLFESQKQIVISSDKHPASMKMLEERLRSRFEMGLTVDITPPTYETRMAILARKVQEEGLSIDNSILEYIASNISSNIRELQGAITKVIALSKLRHKDITMDLAKQALADMINPDKKREITIDFIIETVADHFSITPNDIVSSKRNNSIAHPRQICMYLSAELTNNSLQEIASHLNRKDHSTIIHGRDSIKKQLEENENSALAKDIDILIKKINPE